MSEESKDDQATLQMMALVGEAITRWSYVEQTLSNIFTVCVIPCPTRPEAPDGGYVSFIDSQVPTAIFYSAESFRGKLSLVDAALLARLKGVATWAVDFRAEWSTIKDKTRKLSLKRNSLAHGTVTPAFTDDDSYKEPKLMPPFGSPGWWAENSSIPPGKSKGPEQLKHLIRAFVIIDDKLRCFYQRLAQHPKLHERYDQLTVRLIRSHDRLNQIRGEYIRREIAPRD